MNRMIFVGFVKDTFYKDAFRKEAHMLAGTASDSGDDPAQRNRIDFLS